ncbi:MAG: hypothetical protein GW925_00735 [Candidatus Pacebacteria bacterium]|nr:hypothetical protein [Candidatus Paceibacterota bacterium]
MKNKPRIIVLLLLFSLTLFASFPLFHSELFSAHDIWHQVARLYHYNEVVLAGDFPPRWVASLASGYGYPLFIFSYHLPWLFALPLTLSCVSIFTSIRVLFIFGLLTSATSMYVLLFRITKKNWASFVGATIYVWAPYHFLSVYVAAAIGTVFMFALLPLLFLGIHLTFDRSYKWGILAIATAISGSVLTHLMTLAMIAPFAVIFFATQAIKKKSIIKKSSITLGAVLLGLLISAFYLLPLLAYLPNITASAEGGGLSNNFQRYFPSLRQLIYSTWGYGPIISNAKDGDISMQIGIAQWLSFGLSVVLLFATNLKFLNKLVHKSHLQTIIGYCTLFILSIYFMLDFSLPFWNFTTKFIALDFPFRLLLLSVFSGSMLATLSLASLENKQLQIFSGIALVLIALYTNRNHRNVNMYTQYALEEYVGAETTTNTYHEYLPITAKKELLNTSRENIVIRNNRLITKLKPTDKGVISLHQFSFPGIAVTVDGESAQYETDDLGRVAVDIPENSDEIEVFFQKNKITKFSEFLSMASIVIIFVLLLQPKNRKT